MVNLNLLCARTSQTKATFTLFTLAFLLFVGLIVPTKSVVSQEGKKIRDMILQDALRSLLDVETPLSSEYKKMSASTHSYPSPPEYMLELYARYQSGQDPNADRRGDTVRSIIPRKGKLKEKNILVFNLTGIRNSERIISSELHLLRRRRIKGSKWRRKQVIGFQIHLLDFSTVATSVLQKLEMSRHNDGWQTYNVTKGVTACCNAKADGNCIFAAKLNVHRSNGRYKSLDFFRAIQKGSVPFLIIFSEDERNKRAFKGLEGRHLPKESWKMNTFPSFSNWEDHERYENKNHFNRSRRSIWDNEIPTDVIYSKQIKYPKSNALHFHKGNKKQKPGLIPYSEESHYWKSFGKSRNIRRKNKRKRRRKNRILPQFFQPKSKLVHKNDASRYNSYGSYSQLCQRRKLTVNFADIGWSRWIIAPTSLETNYCVGLCPFPLTKEFRPSNHALIQSIVNAIGLNPDVPAPCCVPDSLSSVTLLYFDEDENVILKNYPNMSVQNCACR
ncbi:bone morphogenetic protein 3-like [Tachypleus tridentatus]|uniref:bone morphogenetic protein 3-like n=1 Tax=Tachypleus tridentatus TaxID=6853 RepID=UPI003FD28AF5